MSQGGDLPSVTKVLDLPRMAPTDEAAYTVAASMTEYLQSLSPGDQRKFVHFVEEGMRNGWDTALSTVYGIHNVSVLQKQWEVWVSRNGAAPRVASHRHGVRRSKVI